MIVAVIIATEFNGVRTHGQCVRAVVLHQTHTLGAGQIF